MDVGDWITEPELHAPDRSGWCPRWRLRSFSARLRFARLSCLAGQIELLEEFRNKPSAANRCLRFLVDYTWRSDGTGESLLFLDELCDESHSQRIANRSFTFCKQRVQRFEHLLLTELSDELF